MIKKLVLLMASAAAVAFAVPSMASAAPAVTFPAGTRLAVGSPLEFTGNDVTFTSSILGVTTCATLNFKGILTRNEASVEGSGEAEKPDQEGCTSPHGPVVMTSFDLVQLVITTSGSGTMSFTAVEDVGPLTCKMTGTNVPFTYTVGGDNIVFNNAIGISVSPPGCGTIKFDATFTVETKVSGAQHAVILD